MAIRRNSHGTVPKCEPRLAPCGFSFPAKVYLVTPPSRDSTQRRVGVPASKGFGSPDKAIKPKSEREWVPPPTPCACLSGKAYKNCCEPVHTGAKNASTPELALRSRFSAFALGLESFVSGSTHPECKHTVMLFVKPCHAAHLAMPLTIASSQTRFDSELRGKVAR